MIKVAFSSLWKSFDSDNPIDWNAHVDTLPTPKCKCPKMHEIQLKPAWNCFFQLWYVQSAKVSSNHAIFGSFDQIIGQK